MITIDYARTLYPANADSAHDFDHVLRVMQLADKIAQAEGADREIVRVAALLLVSVFALKAALVPLHLWLPRTYAVSTPAVAALFALMTKVGVYSIIRVVPWSLVSTTA